MQFPTFLTILLSVAALTLAHVLPYNASNSDVGDYVPSIDDLLVQTAGSWSPDNIASDEIWDRYQKKGAHYQCLFPATNEAAGRLVEDKRTPPSAQSVWAGNMIAERKLWYWNGGYFDEDLCNFDAEHFLKPAFDALKLNAYCDEDGGNNVGWALTHYDEGRMDKSDPTDKFPSMLKVVEQTYKAGQTTYMSTGGYYTFTVNQADGAIVALDISSPSRAVKTHWRSRGVAAKEEELPKLRHMSDLVWGKWVDGNKNVKNLRVYIVHNVLNTETTAIVSRAMRNKKVSKLSVWPGVAFEKDTDVEDFQTLIGSPIGATMSILLAQHKAELGNKEIFQVNVVADSNSVKPSQVTELHMFFQVRDVPPPKKPEDDKPEDGTPTGPGAEGVAIAARGLSVASSPAVNHVLHERKEILNFQDLPASSDAPDSDDYSVQTGLEWKDRSVASDAAWKTYVDKGNHFDCLMRSTPEAAQKLTEGSTPVDSPWTGTLSKFKTWGWHEGEVETDFDCDFERLYLEEMFTGLGLDAKPSLDNEDMPAPGHNTCFKLQHFDKSLKNPKGEELDVLQQPYVVDGVTRYATGAYYNFGINSGGAIIGMDLVSPRYAVTERHNWNREAASNELPALRYMSDIFFGYWRRITSNPKNLRYYIATHVVNDDTVKLVARALKNNKLDDLSEWPGVTFETDSEEWAALVGSPIGASIAALLSQHKAELGLKYVPKVTVVYDANPEKTRDRKRFRPWLHMVFYIEDVRVEE